MEGIITGIGDKELGKNLIKPEYDAVINDFIIGKNTILEGLVLNGNNLSAGTCILCGYRGIIEESKTLDTTAYVYGEFILNFDTEIEDSFNIVTSTSALTTNVNPTEITSAGTYYLLLYENGVGEIDREHRYPLKSQYSAETDYVGDNAVISETATTPTETNELGEIETDLHLSQPNRVANTEYVHAQIQREIDYGVSNQESEKYFSWVNSGVTFSHTITMTPNIQRKAKFCICELAFSIVGKRESDGQIMSGQVHNYNANTIIGRLEEKYYPQKDQEILCSAFDYDNPTYSFVAILKTNGDVVLKNNTDLFSGLANPYKTSFSFGYQCQ